jgi:flagellar biosynthesis/type III secretory pathway M-ring protein FliF/YscJ
MQKIKDFWNDSSKQRKIAIVVAGIVLVIFVIKAI